MNLACQKKLLIAIVQLQIVAPRVSAARNPSHPQPGNPAPGQSLTRQPDPATLHPGNPSRGPNPSLGMARLRIRATAAQPCHGRPTSHR